MSTIIYRDVLKENGFYKKNLRNNLKILLAIPISTQEGSILYVYYTLFISSYQSIFGILKRDLIQTTVPSESLFSHLFFSLQAYTCFFHVDCINLMGDISKFVPTVKSKRITMVLYVARLQNFRSKFDRSKSYYNAPSLGLHVASDTQRHPFFRVRSTVDVASQENG